MDFESVVNSIHSLVWGLPLIAILLSVGFYFSFKLKFLQVKHLKEGFGYVLNPHKGETVSSLLGDISSFGSLCTALSAILGTGSIVGIAVALSIGGPGTLFWIVVSSFFSLPVKYCEGFLAIKYRKIGSDGKIAGGPMYYIEAGLKKRFWAKLFALFGIVTAIVGTGTLAQTNSMASAANFFGIPNAATAVIVGSIVALVIFGGINRIADVAEKVVPFMTILYVFTAMLILSLQYDMIWPALKLIVSDAFAPKSIVGGIGGALVHSIQIGVSRGIFCHESGLGSTAIAAAAAKIKSPVKQGLICMVGVFLSIIVCLMTGLVLITTSGGNGLPCVETAMTAYAFGTGLGMPQLGNSIVNISILFFAFTTIVGWDYYGEKCVQYAFGIKYINIYRALYVIFVFIGPFFEIKMIFVMADIVVALMALPNILSLLSLRKEIIGETKKFYQNT